MGLASSKIRTADRTTGKIGLELELGLWLRFCQHQHTHYNQGCHGAWLSIPIPITHPRNIPWESPLNPRNGYPHGNSHTRGTETKLKQKSFKTVLKQF